MHNLAMKSRPHKFTRLISAGFAGIAVLLVVWTFFRLTSPASAEWFDDTWPFRKPVTFNNASTSVTDQKVKLDLDTATLIAAGKMQSDCDDARFTNNTGQVLLYYLDSSGGACNTSSTDFYVLLPIIEAGNNVVWFYYGNMSASAGTTAFQLTQATFSTTATAGTEQSSTRPVLYWSFSEDRGSVVNDGTGNDNDGALAASATIDGGDGSDGAITVSSSLNCSTTDISTADGDATADCVASNVSGAAASGQAAVTVASATGFVAGDEVLVMQVTGSGQGNYEFKDILSIASNTLTMTTNLTNSYGATGAQVVRVPQYTNVTIQSGGTFTASAWTGTAHGVVAFRASGTVDVQSGGSISAAALGFTTTSAGPGAGGGTGGGASGGERGGGGGGGGGQGGSYGTVASTPAGGGGGGGGITNPTTTTTNSGGNGGSGVTSATGSNASTGAIADAAAGGGGGGGGISGSGGSGGSGSLNNAANAARNGGTGGSATGGSGGGGNGAAGQGAASTGNNGSAGSALGTSYGAAALSTMYFGSNGAIGGTGGNANGGTGGAGGAGGTGGTGGGIIFIAAPTLTVTSTGSITASGAVGGNGTTGGDSSANATAGGGGGGGGGGGSGGSIYLSGNNISIGTSLVSASGGTGGTHGNGGSTLSGGAGGTTSGANGAGAVRKGTGNRSGGGGAGAAGTAGGDGRIHIDYGSTPIGTTSPSAHTTELSGTIAAARKNKDYCHQGGCLSLNGATSAYRGYNSDTELNPGTAGFSVSLWFRHPTVISGTDTLISRYASAGYKIYMNSSGKICFAIDDDSSFTPDDEACTTSSYADNRWHNLTAVKSGTTSTTVYIDGVVGASVPSIVATGSLSGSSPTIYLGVDSDGASNYWDGMVDEVKIYNFAQTVSQVKGNFVSGKGSAGYVSSSFGEPATSFLTDGLVGYWTMDETDWTNDCSTNAALDTSGNGYHGDSCPTTTGPDPSALSKFGRAGSFDNSDDRLEMGDVLDMTDRQPFTISSWVYRATATEVDTVIAKKGGGGAGQPGYMVQVTLTGQIAIYMADGTDQIIWYTPASSIPTTTWTHVAVVYDGTTTGTGIFINGNRSTILGTSTGSPETINDLSSAQVLKIGAESDNELPFSGRIDDTRIYNRALSPQEVKQLYNWAPDPLAWFKMDENTGTTTTYDSSKNGFDGTLMGSMSEKNWINGKYGAALNLDGTDDKINFYSSNFASKFNPSNGTVSGWVKVASAASWTDATNDAVVEIRGADSNNRISIYNSTTDNTFETQYIAGSTIETGTVTTSTTNWFHFAITWNGTTGQVVHYFNGVAYNTDTALGTWSGPLTSTRVVLGSNQTDSAGNSWAGGIDDIKVYDYARTPGQITEDYNGNHPVGGSPIGSQALYLKFDEGYGDTAYDSSPNGNNGDLASTGVTCPQSGNSACPSWSVSGKFDKALSFDISAATDDYLTIPDSSSLDITSQGTISAWVKFNAFSAAQTIISKWNTTNQYSYNFLIDNANTIRFVAEDDGNVLGGGTCHISTSAAALSAGTWYHLTATFNAGVVKIYKNGVELSTAATAACPTSIYAGTASAAVGATLDGPTNYMNGYIDELKVYSSALTLDQIYTEYNHGASTVLGSTSTTSTGVADNSFDRSFCVPGDSSTCSAPIGYYPFDDNTGTTTYDRSGNNLVGTLSGGMSASNWRQGKVGSALKFNGTSEYVSVADNALLDITGDFTISMWVNRTGNTGTHQVLLTKLTSTVIGAYVVSVYETGVINCITSNGATTDASFTDAGWITASTGWTHLEVVRSGTSCRVYVNGVDRTTTLATHTTMTANNNALWIGGMSGVTQWFSGELDDIRIYNYARSTSQRAWDYNRGAPWIWTKFDECQGTSLHDASGNGNTATITIGATGSNTSAGNCTSGTSTEAWYNGVAGKRNYSLDFDGTSDKAAYADDLLDSESVGSFCLWFYFDEAAQSNTNQIIVGYGDTASTTYKANLYIEDDADPPNLSFYIRVNGPSNAVYVPTTSGLITRQSWHHACVVQDGTGPAVYLDGLNRTRGVQVSGTGAASNWFSAIGANAEKFTLGILDDNNDDDWFDGKIDDFRYFRYPLTAAQVKNIYNDGAVSFQPETGSP